MSQQQVTPQQLAEVKATCEPTVHTSTRQVPGGLIVTGQVQWSKDGHVIAVQQDECVCGKMDVGIVIEKYHLYHSFTYSKPDPQK